MTEPSQLTTKGYPYPAGGQPRNEIDNYIKRLAEKADARPGISPLSTTARDALSGVELWTGRVIYNTTNLREEVYTGSAWAPLNSDRGCGLNGSATSVPTATATILAWPTESWDTDAFHSTVTNTSRITIPAGCAGRYLIAAAMKFSGSIGSNPPDMRLYKNGSLFRTISAFSAFGAGPYSGSVIVDAAVADYFEIAALQSSGGTLTMSGDTDTRFAASLLGYS